MTTYWMQDYQTETGRKAEIIIHPAERIEHAQGIAEDFAHILLGLTAQPTGVTSFRAEVPPSAPKGFDSGIPALHFTYEVEAPR